MTEYLDSSEPDQDPRKGTRLSLLVGRVSSEVLPSVPEVDQERVLGKITNLLVLAYESGARHATQPYDPDKEYEPKHRADIEGGTDD